MTSEPQVLPISVIVPTAGRAERLLKTLRSLQGQASVKEVVVVAVGTSQEVADQAYDVFADSPTRVVYQVAQQRGAAAQRNQAFASSQQPYVLFIDNDIDMESGCLDAMWQAMQSNPKLGGVGVHIINQSYHAPGRVMRHVYQAAGCPLRGSLAGRCCGPALNFLPSPTDTGEAVQRVDWLNSTCTLYRRDALPNGLFPEFFVGYSLMEDLGLSLMVAHTWDLAVANQARIYHDSQPQDYKSKRFARHRMEVVNRYFIATRCMGQRSAVDFVRFWTHQLAMLGLSLRTASGWCNFPTSVAALVASTLEILTNSHKWKGFGEQ